MQKEKERRAHGKERGNCARGGKGLKSENGERERERGRQEEKEKERGGQLPGDG